MQKIRIKGWRSSSPGTCHVKKFYVVGEFEVNASNDMGQIGRGGAKALWKNSAGTRLSKHLAIICWSRQLNTANSINLQMAYLLCPSCWFQMNCTNIDQDWSFSRNGVIFKVVNMPQIPSQWLWIARKSCRKLSRCLTQGYQFSCTHLGRIK